MNRVPVSARWSMFGRLYDLIDDGATGRVLYVLPQGLVCELEETGFEKVKKIYKKHRHY